MHTRMRTICPVYRCHTKTETRPPSARILLVSKEPYSLIDAKYTKIARDLQNICGDLCWSALLFISNALPAVSKPKLCHSIRTILRLRC